MLSEQARTPDFARIYGRGKAASSVAVLLAMALGGFLAQNGYEGVLLLSALAPFASGVLVIGFIREPARSYAAPEGEDQAPPFNEALASLRRQPRLRLIAMMFIAFVGLAGVMDEYIGPLLKEELAMSLGTVGLIYGGVLGFQALGNAAAHRLASVPLKTVGWISGISHLLLETGLQDEIDVSARATITSVAGAGLEIWVTGLFLAIGALAIRYDWSMALAMVAFSAVVVSLALSLLRTQEDS